MSDAETCDYMPFVKGAVWEYKRAGNGSEGTQRTEMIEVAEKKGRLEAKVRCTTIFRGKTEESEVTLVKEKDGIYSDGTLDFPLPPRKGKTWRVDSSAYEIIGHDSSVTVPAGKYSNCMKILQKIADGDAGTIVSLFAPGVGLVYEESAEESEPFTLLLTSVTKLAG